MEAVAQRRRQQVKDQNESSELVSFRRLGEHKGDQREDEGEYEGDQSEGEEVAPTAL